MTPKAEMNSEDHTPAPDKDSQVELRSGQIVVAFDRQHGNICSLRHEGWGYEIIADSARAESWRLLLPLENFPGHCIYSKAQTLTGIKHGKDNLILTWENVAGEDGTIDIEPHSFSVVTTR